MHAPTRTRTGARIQAQDVCRHVTVLRLAMFVEPEVARPPDLERPSTRACTGAQAGSEGCHASSRCRGHSSQEARTGRPCYPPHVRSGEETRGEIVRQFGGGIVAEAVVG